MKSFILIGGMLEADKYLLIVSMKLGNERL